MPYYLRNRKLHYYNIRYRGVMLNIMYNQEIKSIVFWKSKYMVKKWMKNLHPAYEVLGYEIVYTSYDRHAHEVVVAFVPCTCKHNKRPQA